MREKKYHGRMMSMVLITLLFLSLFFISEHAQAYESDKWQFSVQPYVWFPTMEAEMKFSASGGSPSVEVEPDDYFENLNAALILTAEARKGKWSLVADLIFMKLETSAGKIKNIDFGRSVVSTDLNLGSDVEMKSFISTFGGGYQILENSWLKMDMIAGLRYLWMESKLDWRLSGVVNGPNGRTFDRNGNAKEDGDIWNGVAGVRGHILLGQSNWYIPFYADMGAGDSDLTWQLFSGFGYSFSDRIQALLGYRHIEFEKDGNLGIQDLRLSGPALGMRISF